MVPALTLNVNFVMQNCWKLWLRKVLLHIAFIGVVLLPVSLSPSERGTRGKAKRMSHTITTGMCCTGRSFLIILLYFVLLYNRLKIQHQPYLSIIYHIFPSMTFSVGSAVISLSLSFFSYTWTLGAVCNALQCEKHWARRRNPNQSSLPLSVWDFPLIEK